jgi:hypothetical protein
MDKISFFALFAGNALDETTSQDTLTMDDGNARRTWTKRPAPSFASLIWIANRDA